ncbi:RNA polymerase sigma-70 factor, ECF subfamily [Frankia sp. AiPs1]|uniref:sigma-70 family RNA polymerase sigma factor n=1 Tax=Frankia sp. AiPa1 TaxID=573492 RepID=UPI00202B5CBE|nr:sigma-70 family RNA polymerase sigma factor [Frankia sp. AiPa1]MCL9759322.1 sigma-70 family RNA polymerase sigma factor [Frankia sp. AiPa1]
MTDCTFTSVAAGLAASRRGRDVWRAPVAIPPSGWPDARVGLRQLRRWILTTAVAATGPSAGPRATSAPAGPTALGSGTTPGTTTPGTATPGTAPTDAGPARLLRDATAPLAEPAPGPDGEPDPGGPSDRERAALVARARRGDSDAFGALYDHYADLVFRYALYRVGGDPAAAEDVVSETFLRALRTIGAFRWQGRDIGAWFITIARNLMVDQARSARRRFEIPTADVLAAADRTMTQVTPGPEELIVTGLTHQELLAAIRRLRPDQRECVALRFLEGLSVRETALAMGRNEGAIRALQLRAVRTLARSLPALEAT